MIKNENITCATLLSPYKVLSSSQTQQLGQKRHQPEVDPEIKGLNEVSLCELKEDIVRPIVHSNECL